MELLPALFLLLVLLGLALWWRQRPGHTPSLLLQPRRLTPQASLAGTSRVTTKYDQLTKLVRTLPRLITEGGEHNRMVVTLDEGQTPVLQVRATRSIPLLFGELTSSFPESHSAHTQMLPHLVTLGWQPSDFGRTRTFRKDWTVLDSTDYLAIAQELLQVLVQAYGLSSSQDLQIETVLE